MTLYHRLFQRIGMTPDEFEAKPAWVRRFIIASEKIASEPKGGDGNG